MKKRQYRFLQICTLGELTINQLLMNRRLVKSPDVVQETTKLEHKMKRLNQWVGAYTRLYYPGVDS